jgi:hypothetical protein
MNWTKAKYELDGYPDGCDFLAKTVYETYWLPPIGFVIHRKERVRVKAVCVKREDAS